MKVLVTGGTGFLGTAVVRALAARGHQPIVLTRMEKRGRESFSGAPETGEKDSRPLFFQGDVRERAAIARAARGCDAICHLAALVSIWRKQPHDFDEVNVGGLQNVVDAGTSAGISRIVYTSSFLALAPRGRSTPLEANDYQRTKVVADTLADSMARSGAPIVRVYPGVVYGPGTLTEGNFVGKLIADHLNGRLPGLIGPENLWSYSYIDDVAAGHCAALERGGIGERYVLGGENATQRQVFALVEAITGRRSPRRIPFPVASAIGALEEARAVLTGARPLVTRGAVEIFRHDWSLDSSRAQRDLGYRITPLAEGIRRTVDFVRGLGVSSASRRTAGS